MIYSQLIDLYFSTRKEKFDSIKNLEERREVKLFAKLLNDHNEINFFSWISEMNFGLRIDKIASMMSYDKLINNKTPDWIITANNQTIIFEVVKINLDEISLNNQINDFKNSSISKEKYFATSTLRSMDGNNFYGAESKIVKKEITYRKIIEENGFPFIICVDCSEPTLFISHQDFLDFFVSMGQYGYFSRNKNFGQNVTGLYIFVDGGYKFIYNPHSINKLNKLNFDDIYLICD